MRVPATGRDIHNLSDVRTAREFSRRMAEVRRRAIDLSSQEPRHHHAEAPPTAGATWRSFALGAAVTASALAALYWSSA
jgi:hypothetical protein